MCACQLMPGTTNEMTRLSPISVTTPRASAPTRSRSTTSAPKSPKTAPEAPTPSVSGGLSSSASSEPPSAEAR